MKSPMRRLPDSVISEKIAKFLRLEKTPEETVNIAIDAKELLETDGFHEIIVLMQRDYFTIMKRGATPEERRNARLSALLLDKMVTFMVQTVNEGEYVKSQLPTTVGSDINE